MFDLFEMLGIEVQENTTSKEKKKAEKKSEKEEKKNKKEKSDQIVIGSGFTIITAYYPPALFTSEDFGDKAAISFAEAKEAFQKLHSEFCAKYFTLYKMKENEYLLVLASSAESLKETSKPLEKDFIISIAEYKCEVPAGSTFEDIKNLWERNYPEFTGANYYCFPEESIIFPVMNGEKPDKIELPAKLNIFGRESIDIVLPDENIDDAEDDQEEDDKEIVKLENPVSYDDFKMLVKKNFMELDDNFKVIKVDGNLYLVPEKVYSSIGTISKPKEKTYPTNAVVSLIFTRLQLSPDFFGGKKTVNTKDFLAWLQEDYPEYSEERTSLEYDEKTNTIIPVIKSSSKGMMKVDSIAALDNLLENQEYLLARLLDNGASYRVEKTPVGVFVAPDAPRQPGGFFKFRLPKIPAAILEEVYSFFQTVVDYGMTNGLGPLESAAQIFYSDGRYFVVYPLQRVERYNVDFERNADLERNALLVADIHSHNIMSSYFSLIDDRDEKGTRLYMVMGDLSSPFKFSLKLRAGTGGKFIDINNPNDIFEEFCRDSFRINPSSKEHLSVIKINVF